MSQDNPQSVVPGSVPEMGEPISQQAAAAVPGPDSIASVPNPMQGIPASTPGSNWEERFKGLSRKYNEDQEAWKAEKDEVQGQFVTLEGKFQELEKNLMAASQPTEPKEVPKVEPDDGTQDYLDSMAQRDAETFRDKLLFEYINTNPSLGLAGFRDNIPVVAPTVGDDGTVDDSEQRKAIETFIGNLKGVGKQQAQVTQKAMTEGWTPGVSPEAPSADSWDSKVNEYYRIKTLYGSQAMDAMSDDEKAETKQQYYALHEEVGKHLPNQSKPWLDSGELAEEMRQVLGRVGHLEGFMMRQP